MANYAKIDTSQTPHVIVDVVVAQPSDTFVPNFTWTDITSYNPPPQIGWTTTDDVNFTHPGLPFDAYGNSVSMQTVGGNDVYKSSAGFLASVPTGTSSAPAYLSLAIQANISKFTDLLNTFIDQHYDQRTIQRLQGVSWNAQRKNLTNRLAYLSPLFDWQDSVIAYAGTYIAGVKALTDPSVVATTTPDFSSLAASDPLISGVTALGIPN